MTSCCPGNVIIIESLINQSDLWLVHPTNRGDSTESKIRNCLYIFNVGRILRCQNQLEGNGEQAIYFNLDSMRLSAGKRIKIVICKEPASNWRNLIERHGYSSRYQRDHVWWHFPQAERRCMWQFSKEPMQPFSQVS